MTKRGSFFVGLTGLVGLVGAVCLAGCEGRPRGETTADGKTTEPPRKTGPAIAVVDLGSGVPEHEAPSLFGGVGRKKSFDELLQVLQEVKDDKKSVGVLVRFGSASIGAARSMEIGEHLEALRAKKKVYCHGDGFTNATIMAAVRGCDRIYVSPA